MPAQTAVFLAVQIEISANHDINGPYGLENNHSQSYNTELSGLIDFIVIWAATFETLTETLMQRAFLKNHR